MPRCAKAKRSVQSEEGSTKINEDCFLGSIDGDIMKTKWSVNLSLGRTTVRFKIDIGADVRVIPESLYRRSGLSKLQNAKRERAV